jgi:hypothetical protein
MAAVSDGFTFGDLDRNFIVPYRERHGLRYAYYDMDIEFEKQNPGPVKRFAGRVRRRLNSVWAGSGTGRKPKAN